MPKFRIFRSCGDAFEAVIRNAPWLLLYALPLLALHAYTTMHVQTLIRVAFFNSYLKPADALARGGYELKMVPGWGIEAGPGYSFPPELTITVFVLEAIALIAFVGLAQRRLLRQTSKATTGMGPEGFSRLSRLLAIVGLAAVLLAFLVIFVPRLDVIGIQLPIAVVRIWASQYMPQPFASQNILVFCLLSGWLLIKLGNVFLAIASNDRRCLRLVMIPAFRADFWRTIGLVLVLAMSFALVHILPPLLEKAYVPGQMPQDLLGAQILVFSVLLLNFLFMRTYRLIVLAGIAFAGVQLLPLLIQRAYFDPGQVPLGFLGVQVYALSAMVLQFWFMLAFFLAMLCVLYSHYRARLDTSDMPVLAVPNRARLGGIEASHSPSARGAPITLRRTNTFGRKTVDGGTQKARAV